MTDNQEMVGTGTLTAPPSTGTVLDRADHAMGIELQIVELVEQQTRARVQHREDDAAAFDDEIARLRAELATTADPATALPGTGDEMTATPDNFVPLLTE